MTARSKITDLNVYSSYKGGDTLVNGGYIFEFLPTHPLANGWGFVAQHRLIGADLVGRPLVREGDRFHKECVHHKDEDKLNNDPDNLQVMTQSDHWIHHAKARNVIVKARLQYGGVRASLEKHQSVLLCAKELGVHHQTLRNRFPDLVKPYLRKSPVDTEYAVCCARLVEVARYFAPTDISFAELAKLTRICMKSWRAILKENGIEWYQSKTSMKGRRLVYRGVPTQYAKGLCAKQTESA